jgi:hypothetical protein
MDWLINGLNGLLKLWERGKTLLWALAAICVVVLAILFGGKFLSIAGAQGAFETYELVLVLGAAIFAVLAGVKTIEDRRRPSVHIIANDRQSMWGQSTQTDGRVTTQLSLRMQVTNLRTRAIKLSAVRLVRPWTRAPTLENMVITRSPLYPQENTFSHENPIAPRTTTEASCVLILGKPVGRPGRNMTAVIKVSDQFGRWHRVKFRLMDPRGPRG